MSILRHSFFSILLIVGALNIAASQTSDLGISEYKLKLALIEKMVQNVEWPARGDSVSARPPFIFGLYGELQPFGEDLMVIRNNGLFKKRPVKIVFYDNIDALKDSQPDLLFIPREHSKEVRAVAQALGNQAILIIAETYNDVDKGALIDFYLYDDAMHCQLNLDAFRYRNLVPSANLIQLGE